jgi:hypothetical protein
MIFEVELLAVSVGCTLGRKALMGDDAVGIEGRTA